MQNIYFFYFFKELLPFFFGKKIGKDSVVQTGKLWTKAGVVGPAKDARDGNRTQVGPQVHWHYMSAH